MRKPSVVERADRLHVPHRKRLTHPYVAPESGARDLCLYYGTKEVMFDEQRFFAFGDVRGGATDPGLGERLRARVRDDWPKLNQQRIPDRYEHDVHVDVYTDTCEQSWRALRSPIGAPMFAGAP